MIDPAELDRFFKFKIGDWVRPVGAPRYSPLLVVERHLQQCHGGVQVHYKFRGWKDGTTTEWLYVLTEIELEPCESAAEWNKKKSVEGHWRDVISTIAAQQQQPPAEPRKNDGV